MSDLHQMAQRDVPSIVWASDSRASTLAALGSTRERPRTQTRRAETEPLAGSRNRHKEVAMDDQMGTDADHVGKTDLGIRRDRSRLTWRQLELADCDTTAGLSTPSAELSTSHDPRSACVGSGETARNPGQAMPTWLQLPLPLTDPK